MKIISFLRENNSKGWVVLSFLIRLRGVEQVGRENLQAAIKRRDCAF